MKDYTALARVLRVLVLAAMALVLFCILIIPGCSAFLVEGGPKALYGAFTRLMTGETDFLSVSAFFLVALVGVWGRLDTALLTLFYWLVALCAAMILWQAKVVLDTILEENPFRLSNAVALSRAAKCCWIISGAALLRLVLWLFAARGPEPFFTYNALCIPILFMAGLLFQVMSALFRQAAELKEDQDLTI